MKNYPLGRAKAEEGDPRFTLGLTYELGQVLEKHGFPAFGAEDHLRFRQALFLAIYGYEDDVEAELDAANARRKGGRS